MTTRINVPAGSAALAQQDLLRVEREAREMRARVLAEMTARLGTYLAARLGVRATQTPGTRPV